VISRSCLSGTGTRASIRPRIRGRRARWERRTS
jgi:hypothetical protein